MKRKFTFYFTITAIILIIGGSNCSRKQKNEINYESGVFPEEIFNLEGINSEYDDYNVTLPQIAGELPLTFSSNRNSQGSEFDIVNGYIFFAFSQVNAEFTVESYIINENFYQTLEDKVNTGRDELGPYRFFNGNNGLEYFFWAEENELGTLNIKYLNYLPSNPYNSLLKSEPAEVTALNSSSNDAYICFDKDMTKAYFTSDGNGNFDIVETVIDNVSDFDSWLEGDPAIINLTDSINSDYNDKCPFIRDNIMIFTSDRPGGLGGFDLYYSIFSNGKWSSPNNMGPDINTEHNEYRPLIGSCPGYSNKFLLFSSDRPSGLGGYDLYFTGLDITKLLN
ncbi:MAG TPA: hypothetical protein DEQ09_08235 [Bacteroidales bacterium]|nr:hypothetical protein [Bacteroidales bacterium]